MRIILDTNIWISFLFGKKLGSVKSLFENSDIRIYVSQEMISEINSVISRPKIKRYISEEAIDNMWHLIRSCCEEIEDYPTVFSSVRDIKDVYLLSMAAAIPADIIVTGDEDLLVLRSYKNTKILTYSDFILLLQSLQSEA